MGGDERSFYKKSRGAWGKEGENLPPQSHVLRPALGGWLPRPGVAWGGVAGRGGPCWERPPAKCWGRERNRAAHCVSRGTREHLCLDCVAGSLWWELPWPSLGLALSAQAVPSPTPLRPSTAAVG